MSCEAEHLVESHTGNIKKRMAGERKHVIKIEMLFFPLVPLLLSFSRNNSKRDQLILLVTFIQQNLPTSQLWRWRSLDCPMANPSPVTTAIVGHWPKSEPWGGKLPLLLISTSLKIALLSGGLGFLQCQSSVGCSCAARRLPDCCANHVDEESSCSWREFQLREPNALCVIAKCNVSYEQTFGFLLFFFFIVTLSRESRDW